MSLQEGGDEPTAAVEDSTPAPPPAPAAASAPPAASNKPTATSEFDYEAAEENEISFPENAKIINVVSKTLIHSASLSPCLPQSQEFPDDDWWLGEYNGKQGLFPANYVKLDE